MQRQGGTEVKEHEQLVQIAKSEELLVVKQEEMRGLCCLGSRARTHSKKKLEMY